MHVLGLRAQVVRLGVAVDDPAKDGSNSRHEIPRDTPGSLNKNLTISWDSGG